MIENLRTTAANAPVTGPIALTIAGSDPSGGAGIQADLRTFGALGVVGVSVLTALTAQNSAGVACVHPIDSTIVEAQLETLLADVRPAAVKIGMLGSAAQVEAVASAVAGLPSIVLDPVLASTGGVPLLDSAGIKALRLKLLPLAALVTPNWEEARVLTGIDPGSPGGIEAASRRLLDAGAGAVLIKGGHREGAPIDTLVTRDGIREFHGDRIDTVHTHGAGCFLSSAIAADLAQGADLAAAVEAAKWAYARALSHPVVIGGGRGYAALPTYGSHRKNRSKAIRGLYVLTDPLLRPDRSPIEMARAALAGGARILQMRDKSGSATELIDLARRLRMMCHDAGALFFVNDRVDIAMASEADGVHLGPDDMSPADARRIMPDHMLIGVSVSTAQEAIPVAPYADYLGVGAIYGSSTKLDAGEAVGTGRIREIKAAFPTHPIVAIGGIGESNIREVVDAGADSAAVISAVLCAPDMLTATRTLATAFERD